MLLAVNRTSSKLDELISACDDALRTVFGPPPRAKRASPAETVADVELDVHERELAARLMRVNHTGEVCAQALYQGQALTARLPEVRDKMEQAAEEENDHLAWTQARIDELGGRSSYLNALWYAGSFTIGALAGLVGDKWSLGFVAETERQVVEHLNDHSQRVPQRDQKSRVILDQMRDDEERHATVAIEAGAIRLPRPIRAAMQLTSKIMTRTAYWI
ncbi:MAG: 2-polyprenyl-3-methyl-6-methoxy-1,4-benzoquinone monooxygenase [Acidiferrobacterales bacterium]